jgi:hypothetical protein
MAVVLRKQQSAPPSATDRLAAAEAAIQEGNARLAELSQRRNEALLRDRDSEAAALALEIQESQRLVQGHSDKVGLLRAEVEREANEKRVRESEVQNKQIDALFDSRDEDIAKLAALEKQRVTVWRRVLATNRKIAAAHSWEPADLSACMLTPLAFNTGLAHESYRLSHTPQLLGGQQESADAGLSLPGSKSPRVEWALQPERIYPLVDVFHEAGEFGKRRLRGKGVVVEAVQEQAAVVASPGQHDFAHAVREVDLGEGAPARNGGDAPVANGQGESPPRTEAGRRLGELTRRQQQMVEDGTADGLEYKALIDQIAAADAAFRAEQQVGAQRHGR